MINISIHKNSILIYSRKCLIYDVMFKLLILDVDGVLTTGLKTYDINGSKYI